MIEQANPAGTPLRTGPGAVAADLVEARLGARLAAALSASANQVPPDVAERLRFGRQQALARAAAVHGSDTTAVSVGAGSLALGQTPGTPTWLGPWWPRLGALMPILVLAWGVWMVDRSQDRADARVVVAIDAALLADSLPPEAYADPGFVAFLKLEQP